LQYLTPFFRKSRETSKKNLKFKLSNVTEENNCTENMLTFPGSENEE
jgi:hypothetical protein